ncbi:cation:proton antiporter [Acholeplasma vituli]|uniref:Cation:proton antiporter n=1 Tax=Paracholeplasma vituli TaxID=69473 RepID=A0ABT2PWU3_9MOLU|nr:cation:proton antiporter [Paracholeplasma vituli]MCU0105430.1 cation:proton antiporter [Paracholeplasma vituli]
MDIYGLIFKISIVLLVGFIGAIIARKFKMPNVSGYLVLGLLLGPTMGLIFKGYPGFITMEENNSMEFIGEIALAFIAFSIGSEFAIKAIKKMGKSVIILTTTEVIGAVLIVFIAMLLVPKPVDIVSSYLPFANRNIAFALILASMSAATAPAATLMVIRQYRAYGPVTKAILPITALDDIYGIVVFGFFISIAQILVPQGVVQPAWLMFSKPFIEVFGSVLYGLLVGTIISKAANKFDKNRDDMQVIALIAVLFTIGSISLLNHELHQYGIGFSQLLANIMVGSTIANLAKQPSRSFTAINDFATPFYVMFFTLAGASLDLAVLKQDSLIIWVSLVYIFARGGGKILGILVGAYMVDSPKTVKKYLGIALLPQGGVSLGLLVIVQAQMKPLYPTISTIIMLSILVYETFGPVFAKYSITKAGEVNGLDRLDELSSVEGLEVAGGH